MIAFFFATLYNNPVLLQSLHQSGLPIDIVADRDLSPDIMAGFSPLMIAARVGAFQCMEYLVSQGINVNEWSKDMVITTALRQATWRGHVGCVRYLLEHGAAINDQHPNNGTTALTHALMHPFRPDSDPQKILMIVYNFLEKGVDLSIVNKSGETLFDIAKQHNMLESVEEIISMHQKNVLEALITTNRQDNNGLLML